MALYDLAFPDPTRNARAVVLCGVLGLAPGVLPRLRDTWTELLDDTLVIALYLRIGGPNRTGHAEEIAVLRCHRDYLSDRDDGFDPTYATFRFGLDEARTERLIPGFVTQARPSAHVGEVDTDARWRDAIARVENGEVTPGQLAGFDQLMTALNDTLGEGGGVVRV